MMSDDTLLWRMDQAEKAVKALDAKKADADDVQRMASEFKSLRMTLQWFMGVIATGAIALIVLVIQIAVQGH